MMISLNHTQAQLLQPPYTSYEYIKIPNPPGGSINSTYQIGAYPTVILIKPNRSIAEQDIWPIDNTILRGKVTQHGGIPKDCSATYALSLLANPEEGGTVEGAGDYQPGDMVEVTAIPNEGWGFISWTNLFGGVVSTDSSYSFIMPESNMTLIANFEYFTGTDDLTGIYRDIRIFPNPAGDIVHLHADNKLIGTNYTITDLAGKTVLTGKIQSEKAVLDLGNLQGGIYIFSITGHMNQPVRIIKR